MSSSAAQPERLWGSRAIWILPVLAAGAAGLLLASAVTRVPLLLVLAAPSLAIELAIFAAFPVASAVFLSVIRAPIEGLQAVVVVRAFGVNLAVPDALNLAFFGGAGLWLLRRAKQGVRLLRIPIIKPVLAFLVLILFSGLYAPAVGPWMRDFVKLVVVVIVYAVIVVARPEPRRLKGLLWAIVASAPFPILLGIYQYLNPGLVRTNSQGEAVTLDLRTSATFTHPNTFGFYLVTVVVACWGLRSQVTGTARRVVEVVGIAALLTTLPTLSRNTWAAIGIIILVMGIRNPKIVLGAVALMTAGAFLVPSALDRTMQFFQPAEFGSASNSLQTRVVIWSEALSFAAGSPLLGRGWGAVEYLTGGVPAHNDFLRALVELGYVGFVVYGVFIFSIVRHAFHRARDRSDLPRMMFAFAVAYALMSLFSNNLTKMAFQWYFWVLLGVAHVWAEVVPDPREGTLAEPTRL